MFKLLDCPDQRRFARCRTSLLWHISNMAQKHDSVFVIYGWQLKKQDFFTIYGRRDFVLKKMTYCAHANLRRAADFFRIISHIENTLSLPD